MGFNTVAHLLRNQLAVPPAWPMIWAMIFRIRHWRLLLWVNAIAVFATGLGAVPETARKTNNLIVINYDPVLREHGGVTLQRHLKWNDPRPMTTNLIRYIRESSGGYANFNLVGWINVDAFPAKRDGFRYTAQS